jgi:hypothetical protein
MGQKRISILERYDLACATTTATRPTRLGKTDRRTACTADDADDNVSMDHKTPTKTPLPVFHGKG